MLEDRAGGDVDSLAQATDQLVTAASHRPELAGVISTFRNTVPQYKVDLDREKAETMGVPITDVYDALQTFLGGLYVNDFNRFGRTWRVYLEAEQEFRQEPKDINRFYVRSTQGDMVPLSTLVKITPTVGPEVIYRYNRYRAVKIIKAAAPGYSSGQAAAAMEDLAKQLPNGFGYEWTGPKYREAVARQRGLHVRLGGCARLLFLAALYESWSTPMAVILAVPLGSLARWWAFGSATITTISTHRLAL